MKTRLCQGLLVVAIGGFGLPTGLATTVNIDFNSGSSPTYSGTAAAPDPGTMWNGIPVSGPTGSNLSLMDSLSNPVAATLSWEGAGANGNGGGYDTGVDFSNTGALALMSDQIYVGGGTARITLSSLSPTQPYDVYLYEDRGNNPETTRFQVIGAATSNWQTSTPDNPATFGFYAPEDYVLFQSVLPSAGGTLTIDFEGVYNAYGALNGIQLVTAVPEPGGLMLLALGSLVMFARRRRAC